jgi:hypothetical protein
LVEAGIMCPCCQTALILVSTAPGQSIVNDPGDTRFYDRSWPPAHVPADADV